MIKVLFVCLGNICRSPLAEGVFNKLIKERKTDHLFSCDSAGTSNYHIGELPDPRTLKKVDEYGLLLDHRGRQFSERDFEDFNYILAMDQSNHGHIKRMAERVDQNGSQLFLMRDFDNQSSGDNVPDPYYGGEDGFQHVYELLMESNNNFLNYLVKEHQLD